MELKSLSSVLKSIRCDVTFCIVYDMNTDIDLETGCSVEYAIKEYGDCILERISAENNMIVLHIRK